MFLSLAQLNEYISSLSHGIPDALNPQRYSCPVSFKVSQCKSMSGGLVSFLCINPVVPYVLTRMYQK